MSGEKKDPARELARLLERHAAELASGAADVGRLRGELIRGCGRFINRVDAAGPGVVAAEEAAALARALAALRRAAEARRGECAAALAALRRGRTGIEGYRPGGGRRRSMFRLSA